MFRFAISLTSLLILHGTTAGGAIYFAAENPPLPSNAPAEAPLCYKFQDTVSLEEQLGKLKVKYGTAIYDEKIVKNEDGSRSLLAKKKDEETEITMEYFYSDSPAVCNEYKKQNTLDECFALKSIFGNCDEESKSSRWDTEGESYFLEADYAVSSIIRTKDFIHQDKKKKMVIFESSPSSGYCGSSICTEMIGAAIFSKKENVWKLDIFNKEFIMEYFPRGKRPSNSLKFNGLGKNGIAATMKDIYPSIKNTIDTYIEIDKIDTYTTTNTIIGVANNELHELLSMVTAEEYFRPSQVPYKWTSDIKYADEADHRYDIAIHSYGINGTGRYFDRTRGYAVSEGKLKEVWRDDEKEVDKQDKDIGAICQAVDEKNDLHDTCALFNKGEIDENFPMKSELIEDVCFFHYKKFSPESINKICDSYNYDAAISRYSLLADSELRNKLKINIIPAEIFTTGSGDADSIYIENILPAYFGNHKKQALTEGGCIELGELKEEDKEDARHAEDGNYDNIDIFRLTGKKEILHYSEEGEIESSFYLVIGDEPEKHLRLLESTSSSASKVMPACFSAKGEPWKLKDSAIYSVQGLKRKIYSGILINSSSGKTINRIVSADDKGNCAKLFESQEYIRDETSNSEPSFTIKNMLNLKAVIEIKDGDQVENWLIFRDRTGLAVRYHENDTAVFSLANKKDYEYSSWIR